MSNQATNTGVLEDMRISTPPPKPKWSISMTRDFYARLNVPTAPNWFHRKMLTLVFGIHFKKIEDEE